MNDFHDDDKWQRDQRDRILAPGFYGRYAVSGRYVVLDKGRMANILQQRFAVDTIVQGRDGAAICIEEKIVRWKGYRYECFALETKSCTVPGHESPGWMFYGEADYLLYCFQQENDDLDCWLIDFPQLYDWFWPRESTFPIFRNEKKNRTLGRVVPIEDVRRAVSTGRWLVPARAQSLV